jgi:hypothetical protein
MKNNKKSSFYRFCLRPFGKFGEIKEIKKPLRPEKHRRRFYIPCRPFSVAWRKRATIMHDATSPRPDAAHEFRPEAGRESDVMNARTTHETPALPGFYFCQGGSRV